MCDACSRQESHEFVGATRKAVLSLYKRSMSLLSADAMAGHRSLLDLARADVCSVWHPCHSIRFGIHVALVVSASQVRLYAAGVVRATCGHFAATSFAAGGRCGSEGSARCGGTQVSPDSSTRRSHAGRQPCYYACGYPSACA